MTRPAKIFLYLNISLLVGIGIFFRLWNLDHIPGISGDDSWVVMQLKNLFSGQAFTFITPTHRLVAPTHLLVAAPFSLLPSANILFLRIPTLLAGLALLPTIYFLFRRTHSKEAVLAMLVLVSTFPITIIYSRSMAEMAQLPIAMAFVVYFIIQNRIGLAIFSTFLGMTVHPSCIFLSPMILLGILFQSTQNKNINKRALVLFLSALASILLWQIIIYPYAWDAVFKSVILGLIDPTILSRFLVGLSQVFSGITAIENFAGPISGNSTQWIDALWLSLLAITLIGGGFLEWRRSRRINLLLILLCGLLLSFFLQYLTSGYHMVKTGFERFAIYMVVPFTVIVGLLLDRLFQNRPKLKWGVLWAVVAVGWIQLVNIHTHYFQLIGQTGGEANMAYRAAQVDPKLLAYQWIESDFSKNKWKSNHIVGEDWSHYWPIAYFNAVDKIFKVSTLDYIAFDKEFENLIVGEIPVYKAIEEGSYFVAFPGGTVDRMFAEFPKEQILRHDILDFSGRPAVSIWRRIKF